MKAVNRMFETKPPVRACGRALLVAQVTASAFACAAPAELPDDTHAASSERGSIETVTATPELDPWVRPVVERCTLATGRPWVYRGATTEDVGASFHAAAGDPPDEYVAFAYGNGRIVVNPEWLSSPLLGTVLMHELGHAFRGDHHEHSGVMYYGIGDGVMSSCLTAADLEWACQEFACTDFAAECELPESVELDHPQSTPH